MSALLSDVVVLLVTLPAALESDAPTWIGVICGVLALAAAALGVRSALLIFTGQRSAQ